MKLRHLVLFGFGKTQSPAAIATRSDSSQTAARLLVGCGKKDVCSCLHKAACVRPTARFWASKQSIIQ